MAYPWEREKNPFTKNFAGTSRLRKLIKIDPIYFLLRKIQIDWHQSKQKEQMLSNLMSIYSAN